jgi:peptidoglycan/LPS O-acetylase OafA/YrhL
MRQLPSLTPLRGIAALTVLIHHLAAGPHDPVLPRFFLRGHLGVDLFFMLSGFVLAHVHLQTFLGEISWRTVGAFLWVRFARVYPMHFVVTLVLVAAGGAASLSAGDVVANLVLMQVPWHVAIINEPSWSLSAELYAYLLFPFLALWLWRRDDRLAGALSFLLLIALEALAVAVSGDLRGASDGWPALARGLIEFTLGVLAYRSFHDAQRSAWWQSDVALAAVVAALALAFAYSPDDGVVVAVFPLLLLAAVGNAGIATRLLNAAPLRRLGDVSYSLYLAQIFAITAAAGVARTSAGAALGLNGLRVLTVFAAFGISTLFYRCVEVPCRSFLRDAPGRVRDMLARAA